MSFFDGYQSAAHSIVERMYADDASWTPSLGGPVQTAKVLFNSPTRKEDIADNEFEAEYPSMEYLDTYFIGLADSVRVANAETVIINGNSFSVYSIEKKYDGKTIIASLRES